MSSTGGINDQFLFAEESEDQPEPSILMETAWNILVVDDELDVHQVTKLSLKGLKILGNPLNIIHADSAADAEEKLNSAIEFSVILLDVVMETEDAGLQLVRRIRDEMGNHEIRIILRTGQPGQAPEAEAISNYDINDYRLKTELTRVHLVTSLTAAIRSYQQVVTINRTRKDLALIVDSSNQLMKETSLYTFGIQVLDSITSLMNLDNDAFLSRTVSIAGNKRWLCVAGTGIYSKYVNHTFDLESDSAIIKELETSLIWPKWIPHKDRSTLFLADVNQSEFIFSVASSSSPGEQQLQSLQILMTSIAIGLENQSLVDNLTKLAWEDPLTLLPNRAKILHILETVVMDQGRHDLYVLDIDDFDTVNDSLGQKTGDETLIEIGRRINNLPGDSLVTARLAGDTFAIMGIEEELSAEKISSVFDEPININKSEIRLDASMGVVQNIYECDSATDAMRRATLALHKAKSTMRGSCVSFDPAMEREVDERLNMVGRLGDAINNNQMRLHYQPKIAHADGQIVGMEALMRWPVEDGFIPPYKFIPVAESSGLIFELEYFLVKQTCIDLNILKEAGLKHLAIAINVSIPVLESESFFGYFKDMLETHQIDPAQLYIELTESMMIRNQKLIKDRLTQFRSLGVKCSLDDFGTGYNSLTYLNVLPIDQIKIDKSFVDDIHTSERTKFLNESIINLARNLKLEVVAEGIEHQEQYDLLTELGCDQTQGYLFSKPVALEDLIPWIKSYKPR